MIIGIVQSQNVHLNGFGVHLLSRAKFAQSHQRRFRRWLSNLRIHIHQAHQVLIQQALSQAYFTPTVRLGFAKPYPGGYLAFAHDKPNGEPWVIVSDEPTSLQTFAQYRLRFQVEESFLDLKSNASKRQLDDTLRREFTVLTRIPAS